MSHRSTRIKTPFFFSAGASAQATVYGLGAAEGEFLTETDGGSVSTFVGPKGVVTIVGHGVHDTFPDHGAFDGTHTKNPFFMCKKNLCEFGSCLGRVFQRRSLPGLWIGLPGGHVLHRQPWGEQR
jgi:hypothetical protein